MRQFFIELFLVVFTITVVDAKSSVCQEVNIQIEITSLFGQIPEIPNQRFQNLFENKERALDLLTKDGYIRKGATGSYNGSEIQMFLEPNGAPRFDLNNGNDSNWDTSFSNIKKGKDSFVFISTFAVKDGEVYVGGNFRDLGGNKNADSIAKWNGTSWESLGTGLGQPYIQEFWSSNSTNLPYVSTIAIDGENVYIGGNFLLKNQGIGISSGAHIVKWTDAHGWEALGTGFGIFGGFNKSNVTTIKVQNGKIYAAGQYAILDGYSYEEKSVASLSVFENGTWKALTYRGFKEADDGSFSAHFLRTELINAIEFIDGELIVAGNFTSLNRVEGLRNIAKWDGENWQPLGSGLNADVRSLHQYRGRLYIGGFFTSVNDEAGHDYLTTWNGESFKPLGIQLNRHVYHITSYEGKLWVSGGFTNVNGDENINYFFSWDGAKVEKLGDGFEVDSPTSEGKRLLFFEDLIIVSGAGILTTGNYSFVHRTLWDSESKNWILSSNRNGLLGIRTLADWNNEIYAGGEFQFAANLRYGNYIAQWDGESWHSVGKGLNGEVRKLIVFQNELYVAGSFTDAGGNPNVDYLARWNGATWEGVHSIEIVKINDFAIYQNELIIVGDFTIELEGETIKNIASWNGTRWKGLGIETQSPIYFVRASDNNLFISGSNNLSGSGENEIFAYWNGSDWRYLVQNLKRDGFLQNIEVIDGNLYTLWHYYVTGRWGYANYSTLYYWDWELEAWLYINRFSDTYLPFFTGYRGRPLLPFPSSFILYDNEEFVNFLQDNPKQLSTDGVVKGMLFTEDKMYVFGDFRNVKEGFGNVSSEGIAIYSLPIIDAEENEEETDELERIGLDIFPNPIIQDGIAEIYFIVDDEISVNVFNILGQKIATFYEGRIEASVPLKIKLTSDEMPSGVYLIHVKGSKYQMTKKFVIRK